MVFNSDLSSSDATANHGLPQTTILPKESVQAKKRREHANSSFIRAMQNHYLYQAPWFDSLAKNIKCSTHLEHIKKAINQSTKNITGGGVHNHTYFCSGPVE